MKFIIKNKTDKYLTLIDFINENPDIVDNLNAEFGYGYTHEELLDCAKINNTRFNAMSEEEYIFGENGTKIDQIFYYMLKRGGESDSFIWNLKSYE